MVSLESPEKVALEKRADKMAAEAMAEGEKLDKYGRIGQKVRVVGRFGPGGEEIVGGIIGINSNLLFNEETIKKWRQGIPVTGWNFSDGIPSSRVKVLVAHDEEKAQIIEDLTISQWEPIDE